MGFGDDFRFQTAGEPLVVPIGGERIFVGQRAKIVDGPHAARAGAHDHHVIISFGRQDGMAICFRLAIEELFADC